MIIGFFLAILQAVVGFIVGLLPTIPLPTGVNDAVSLAWGYINALDWLLPIDTILSVLALAMTFHVSILIWRLMHLVGGYLRGR